MSDKTVPHLLSQITDAMAVLLKNCDVDEDQVHQAVKKSFASIEIPPAITTSSRPFPISHRNLLGRMLTYWRNDSGYVDDTGAPLPLPAAGPAPSIESLFHKAASRDNSDLSLIDAESAAKLLVSHASAALNEDGHLYPVSYSFMVNSSTLDGAIANLAYFAEYAGTARHNAYAGQGGLLNAVARVQGLPAEVFPVIQAVLREEGMEFLEKMDAFIESKKTLIKHSDNLRNVGFGIYLINEPAD